ncbi:MAG TPA: septum formation initiator family protein [Planctomycetota bacterium]|nr:septum formation initiator family protein [Planctomycetota bacterium]
MKLVLLYMFRAGLLLMAAGFGSLFADNIIELRKLDERLKPAEAEVVELRRLNLALKTEAKALESDPYYIELTLRRKLKWLRPGEQPIQTPRKSNPSAGAPVEMAGERDSARGGTDDPEQTAVGRRVASVAVRDLDSH